MTLEQEAVRNWRTLSCFLLVRLSPKLTSWMTLPLAGASTVWNKRSLGCFLWAKLSPIFSSFGLALIGAARLWGQFATLFARHSKIYSVWLSCKATNGSLAALTVSVKRWRGKQWSRPSLHDHAELATQDQAQHAGCGTFHADVTERLFRLPASSLVSLSRNAASFDQDDVAGLAAERAFDYHLLKKRM